MSAEVRKQRLRRLDLVFVRSPIYFITACTKNRRGALARWQSMKLSSILLKKSLRMEHGSART
jgi:REP element-mobilizing transposase RayT